jgi:hypothetical protein
VLAAVHSATLVGVDGQPVTVEVHVSQGLPAYTVVGPLIANTEPARRSPRRDACDAPPYELFPARSRSSSASVYSTICSEDIAAPVTRAAS